MQNLTRRIMLRYITLFVFTLVLFPRLTLIAQNNVGIGTQTPSSDAVLELFATNKGFLTPRVTSIERASIPAASNGLLVFDTDVNKFFYWDVSQGNWQIMDDFSNTNEVIKLVTFDEITKELSLQDLGGTYTLDLNILSQNLSFSNDTLFISDKNEIFLGDYHKDSSATNELITNTNFNTTSKDLSITDAGQTFNNDLSILSQTIDLTSDVLSISNQNNVDLSIYHNDSSATNELITVTNFNTETKDLSITEAGQTFNNDLSILSQTIDLTSDVLSISNQNNVDLSIYHNDSSATNEIQGLSTSNDTIFMDRGGFVKLSETDFWNTDGNIGTSPINNFIGTRDNTDFVLKTNNVENMRIKNTGNIGIGTDIPDEKLDVFGNIELSGGHRTVQTQVMTANGAGFSLTLKASDNNNNGFNAQNGGNVVIQGGKGFNWSTGAGGGHVVIRSGANETQANPGFRDGGYIVFQTGAKNNTFIERARMLDNGNFGLGTTTPTSQLDLTEQITIRGGNPGLGKVLTSDANGLATWQNGIADVNNGLYANTGANRIRLGGPLVENTTITQGAFGMNYNLNGSGDFNIQNNGINKFSVLDNGDVQMDATTFYLDESTNRVGVGTSAPMQTLDVNGTVRLIPEITNPGNVPIQNLTVDAQGDVNTSSLTLNARDGMNMNLGGFVTTSTAPKTVDLPGPSANYVVIAKFRVYTFCNTNAEPVNIHFKRYANQPQSFAYSMGNDALTETSLNSFTTTITQACGTADLKITINQASNTLTFELINTSLGMDGAYVVADQVNWLKAF
jgi:hypothetical protein